MAVDPSEEEERIGQAHRLHETVRQIRGRLLNSLAVIDVDVSLILAAYFCDNKTRRNLAFSEVFVTPLASLREGGDELLTFFSVPKAQWKTLRTTNTIERLHEEFRRRVKTQGSLPSEDAALVLLFSLVASGQIKLRRIDGWQKIAAVLSHHTAAAA